MKKCTTLMLAAALLAGCGVKQRSDEGQKDDSPAPAAAPAEQGGMGPAAMANIMAALANAKEPGYWDEPKSSTGSDVDDPHVAVLELGGEITELETVSWQGSSGLPLRKLGQRLLGFAQDDDVAALVVRFGPVAMAMATAEELRGVIAEVAAKKPVHCFIEGADNMGYYLLTACTSIGLTPMGGVAIPGPLVQPMYFKGAFDKYGVQADFLHMGAFKGAAEPFTRTGPSPEMRETYGLLLDGIYVALVDAIAKGRKLEPAAARAAIDAALFDDTDAKAAGLVDEVLTWEVYRDKVVGDLPWKREPIEKEEDGGMAELLQLLGSQPAPRISEPHVALIYAVGEVVDGEGEGGKLGATSEIAPHRLVPALRAATLDDSVKAIVLRVDSPGGSALASEIIWHAVHEAAARKPVVVSMGSLAASGGYYISAPATVIFAQPNTLTGSIGVVGGKIVIGPALERFGVTAVEIGRGKRAGLMSAWRPWNDDERATVRKTMETVYTRFKGRVAEGRKKKPEDVEPIAQGRVWTGAVAKQHGLVDEIGGLDLALAEARKRGGLEADAPVDIYPPRPTLMDILGSFGEGFGAHARVQLGATALVGEVAALLGPAAGAQVESMLKALLSFRVQPVQVRAFLPLRIQ
jgi:protease-4